jgi:triosephosphate isomerase (TIM)
MPIPMIAGNWKMNTTVVEAIELLKQMREELHKISNIEKVVCPPFISIPSAREILGELDIQLGAQNMYIEEKGAFTGEISPLMISEYCKYVILGHSERRQYFHETDEMVSKKIISAINHGLKPILCIGENLTEYESGNKRSVVASQLVSSLNGVGNADTLTVAYEPIWAIGTGKAATGNQANETAKLIRDIIEKQYGKKNADDLRILYGGSVTAANIVEFVSQTDIDGALVGGASLKAGEFISIVKQTSEIKKFK